MKSRSMLPCLLFLMAGAFSQIAHCSDEVPAKLGPPITGFAIANIDQLPTDAVSGVNGNVLAPLIGKEYGVEDSAKIAQAIEAYLQSLGYPVVKAVVSPAKDGAGPVSVTIVISKLDKVLVRKQPPLVLSDSTLAKELGSNTAGAYITRASLERASVVLSDLSGVDSKMTLTPGDSEGTSTLSVDLSVKSGKGSTGSVVFNNYGSSQTGQNGISGNWSFANLTGHGDALAVYGTQSYGHLRSWGADYETPAWVQGSKLKLSMFHSDYELDGVFAGLQSNGTTDTYGLSADYSLERARSRNSFLSVGGTHTAIFDSILGSRTNKSLAYFDLGLHGDSSDAYRGGGSTTYALEYAAGTLATETAYVNTASTFSKAYTRISRKQRVGKLSSWTTTLSGQVAAKNLDPSLKFSIGGPQGVKAFVSDAASGDQGYLLSTEVRWIVPMWLETSGIFQFSVFADSGMVQFSRYPVAGDTSINRQVLQDVGAEVAWGLPGNILVKADYAVAVGPGVDHPNPEDGRVWVQVTKYF